MPRAQLCARRPDLTSWIVAGRAAIHRFFLASDGILHGEGHRSKLVANMTTSRMVIPRGRVSINSTTLRTLLASSRLHDSLASISFSGSQSANSTLMTGSGEIEPTRMPSFARSARVPCFRSGASSGLACAFDPIASAFRARATVSISPDETDLKLRAIGPK